MAAPSPKPLKFDSVSASSMIDPVFDNFTDPDNRGYGLRDTLWWQREWPRDSTVLVERGATDKISLTNFLTAYAKACTLLPGGNPLSSTNRALVLIPAGGYEMEDATQLVVNNDYVDFLAVGTTGSVQKGGRPSVWFYISAPIVTGMIVASVEDVRVYGVGFYCGGPAPALRIGNGYEVSKCVFRDCAFVNDGTVPCVDADPGGTLTIGGLWERCRGSYGFMNGCTVDGKEGRLVSCVGGADSFGGGANGICNGIHDDCIAPGDSFGVLSCSAILRNCVNLSRNLSFPAGSCKLYDTVIEKADPAGLVQYPVTGEVDGGALPAVVVGQYVIVTTAGGGYFVGDVLLGVAGVPDLWVLQVPVWMSCMQPDADYGVGPLYTQNTVYYWNGVMWVVLPLGVVDVQTSDAVFHRCTIVSKDGVSPSFYSAVPSTAKVGHCLMNRDLDVTVTNLYGDGKNVVDTDVEV